QQHHTIFLQVLCGSERPVTAAWHPLQKAAAQIIHFSLDCPRRRAKSVDITLTPEKKKIIPKNFTMRFRSPSENTFARDLPIPLAPGPQRPHPAPDSELRQSLLPAQHTFPVHPPTTTTTGRS